MESAIEEGTGLVTVTVSQDGVAADPGYVPAAGDILCPIEYYLSVFNLAEASVNGNRYMNLAQAVSRYIERYCNTDWVGVEVPSDLMYIAACMIRDRFTESDSAKDPRLQSETLKGYSYTLATPGPAYAKYTNELAMFRIVAFA